MNKDQLSDELCSRVVRLQHERHGIHDFLPLGANRNQEDFLIANLLGQIQGIRYALCLVHGWGHMDSSGHVERADDLVRKWHNRPGNCTEKDCGSW